MTLDNKDFNNNNNNTLLYRAANLLNKSEGKQQEKDRIFDALRSNGYPKMFLTEVQKRRAKETEFVSFPEELERSFFENILPENNRPATQSSPTLTAQRNP